MYIGNSGGIVHQTHLNQISDLRVNLILINKRFSLKINLHKGMIQYFFLLHLKNKVGFAKKKNKKKKVVLKNNKKDCIHLLTKFDP